MGYTEVKIETPTENFEVLQALLGEQHFESFVDGSNSFTGYILDENFDSSALTSLQQNFEFAFTIKKVEEKNWNEEWEKNFDPVIVEDKCIIRADFHSPNPNVKDEVIITPKMSFGTGHHATTYMMANELYSMELDNKSVLDMGCGTAVLAILAKKRGASQIIGIDIDDWAVENSIENCERNDCQDIHIAKGGAEKLDKYQKFDVILANINRNILLEDMKYYVSSLNEFGEIVFSGFYTDDISLLDEEAEKNNLELIGQNVRENWSLLHYKRK